MPLRLLDQILTRLAIAAGLALAVLVVAAAVETDPKTDGVMKVGLLSWSPCDQVSFSTPTPEWVNFLAGMADLGYDKRTDFQIDCKSAQGDPGALVGAVRGLIADKVDAIVVSNSVAADVAFTETHSVPIAARQSYAAYSGGAPAYGNMCGVSDCFYVLSPKRMEVLRDAVPGLKRVGIVYRKGTTKRENIVIAQRTAKRLLLDSVLIELNSISESESTLTRVKAEGVQALYLAPDPVISDGIGALSEVATRLGLPMVGWDTRQAQSGVFLSYSCDGAGSEKRLATFVDKLLHNTEPWLMPVEQPYDAALTINAKTAAKLGISLPPVLQLSATEIVE